MSCPSSSDFLLCWIIAFRERWEIGAARWKPPGPRAGVQGVEPSVQDRVAPGRVEPAARQRSFAEIERWPGLCDVLAAHVDEGKLLPAHAPRVAHHPGRGAYVPVKRGTRLPRIASTASRKSLVLALSTNVASSTAK